MLQLGGIAISILIKQIVKVIYNYNIVISELKYENK